jgi:hypothetical protein
MPLRQPKFRGALDDIASNGLTVDPVGQKLLSYFPLATTPEGTFIAQTPTTASANGFGTKFDLKLNANNSIAARYIFGDSLQSGPPFAGLPAGQGNPTRHVQFDCTISRPNGWGELGHPIWARTRSWKAGWGSRALPKIIDVNNKIDPKSLGVDTGPLTSGDFGVPYVYLLGLGYGGYIGGVQGYPITTRPDQTWDWSEHFSWTKGNHTIRLGGNFQRAYTNSLRNNARTGLTLGYFTYYTGISG